MDAVMQLGGGDSKWTGKQRPGAACGAAWAQEDGGSDH